MKSEEIGRYFLFTCKKEPFYIYAYIYLGWIVYGNLVIMIDYCLSAASGWFAIRGGYMESEDIGLMVGTEMRANVKRVG